MDSNRMPRWAFRYQNFTRAFTRLSALVELSKRQALTEVEQEALVSRFNITWELAWKLLLDYLRNDGVVVDPVTPRAVIRAAHLASLINDVEPWLSALDARNSMAHTYNAERFQAVVNDILEAHHPVFEVIALQFDQRLKQT